MAYQPETAIARTVQIRLHWEIDLSCPDTPTYSHNAHPHPPTHTVHTEFTVLQPTQSVPYLCSTVHALPIRDGPLKQITKLLFCPQVLGPNKVHHTPILQQVVLQWVASENNTAPGGGKEREREGEEAKEGGRVVGR